MANQAALMRKLQVYQTNLAHSCATGAEKTLSLPQWALAMPCCCCSKNIQVQHSSVEEAKSPDIVQYSFGGGGGCTKTRGGDSACFSAMATLLQSQSGHMQKACQLCFGQAKKTIGTLPSFRPKPLSAGRQRAVLPDRSPACHGRLHLLHQDLSAGRAGARARSEWLRP